MKVLPFDINAQGIPVSGPLFDTQLPVGEEGSSFGAGGSIGAARWIRRRCSFPTTSMPRASTHCAFSASMTSSPRTPDRRFRPAPRQVSAPMTWRSGISTTSKPIPAARRRPPSPTPICKWSSPSPTAATVSGCGIFDVAPDTFQISQASSLNFSPAGSGVGGSVFQSTLAVVDFQGRSLRVGRPGIITVNNRQQATLILAAPPMHVDAVVPIGGTGTLPRPFNITAAPDGLFGGYTFSSSTDQTKSTTTGFTTSFSATESVGTTATFGDCDIGDCASVSNKFTANQAAKTSQSSVSGSYSGSSLAFDVTTGFSDLLSYQEETLVIYAYPVIGRTVCPSSLPTCVPLTINVAGPDTVSYKEAMPGNVLPWYQPPWIPGNILSYPGNAQQLQAAAFRNPSDFQELSQPLSWFIGAGGTASASVTWAGGGSSGNTTSTKHNFSYEDDISASGSIGLSDVVTLSGDVDIDLGAVSGSPR